MEAFEWSMTENARQQINLLQTLDFTLEGKFPLVAIDGKKCEGFTYLFTFDEEKPKDTKVVLNQITILLDPFSSFYLKRVNIDFIQTAEREGFLVENLDQALFQKKFFIEHPDLVPDLQKI